MVKFNQSLAYKNGLTLKMLALLEYFSSKQALGINVLEKKEIAEDNILINVDKTLLDSLSSTKFIEIENERTKISFKVKSEVEKLIGLTEVTLIKEVKTVEPIKVEETEEIKELFNYYNELAEKGLLTKASELTKLRIKRLDELIFNHGLDRMKEHLDDLSTNDFFLDKVNNGWYHFDWIFKETQIAKSLENRYKKVREETPFIEENKNKVVRI